MSTTRSAAELRYFRSDFFKIVLKDVNIAPDSPPSGLESTSPDPDFISPDPDFVSPGKPSAGTDSSSNNPAFFIHKALLSTLSPELFKHANNAMKEGLEGVLALSEVHEGTMEAFMEWAYFKDYSVPEPNRCGALLAHTKIYVFADRFNTKILQDLAYSKLTALLSELGMIADRKDASTMMEAVEYAYDNLLLRTTATTTALGAGPSSDINFAINSMEKLLRYFAQYTSWALDVFRGDEVFRKLMATSADFSDAFVLSSRPAASPPWVLQLASGGSSSNTDKQMVVKCDDKNHLLHRNCSHCSYNGVMSIKCMSCQRFDHDIGTVVELYSSEIGTVGANRTTGTKQSYTYTCKWCNVGKAYSSTSTAYFNDQQWGRAQSAYNNAYLYCRKCQVPGWVGYMTIQS